jgi:hypothetical protein
MRQRNCALINVPGVAPGISRKMQEKAGKIVDDRLMRALSKWGPLEDSRMTKNG